MLQRRMNNWITVSDRGIKCLERLSCVHTETFTDEHLINHRGYDDAGIPLKR